MNAIQAARALGVSPSTIRNQCEKGVLAGTKRDGLWDISPEEVARYGRENRGSRVKQAAALRRIHADPEMNAKRRAGLASPATKAKMRAARLGKAQSPEWIERRMAPKRGKPLTAEHRANVSAAQKGKTLAPGHLAKLRKYHVQRRGKPLPMATRRRIAASLAKAYTEGRRSYSTLEDRAATLLEPMGFVRSVVLDTHVFDFGSVDGQYLVEVNGCAWHNHRHRKPDCPVKVRRDSSANDEARRALARLHDRILIELWGCEEAVWPDALALIS